MALVAWVGLVQLHTQGGVGKTMPMGASDYI
jgi:hypothetical protein